MLATWVAPLIGMCGSRPSTHLWQTSGSVCPLTRQGLLSNATQDTFPGSMWARVLRTIQCTVLGLRSPAMEVDPSESPRVQQAVKRVRAGEGPPLMAEQTFILQSTLVRRDGTLYDSHQLTLKSNGKVVLGTGPEEHGQWFLVTDDVLSLQWDCKSRSNARTGVYRRIPNTRTWLQTDGVHSWQLVMTPFEPS
jgi:hypothetical protein